MTREAFLARLREGLRGLPPKAVSDILSDYEAHFAEGEADGRTPAEVAAALGDPGRLARELRVEVGLRRWEEERTPSAAAGAIFAVLGLAALDILVLLPILIGVISVLFAFAIAIVVIFFVGGAIFAAGPFSNTPGGPWAALLTGLGLMAGSVSGGALLTLGTIGLVNMLVWYGRLHFRLLKPAIDPEV